MPNSCDPTPMSDSLARPHDKRNTRMSRKPRQTNSTNAPAVAIYDGRCEFCRTQAKGLVGDDNRIVLRSLHDVGVIDEYPGLTIEACMEEMKLVVDGRIYGGAEAFVRAFAIRHRFFGKVLYGYYIPGIRGIANRAYRWVAKNRYRISGRRAEDCDTGACRRHGQGQ